jgi:pimeloyl-ACP methyl ester carboxylesterase
MTPHPAPRVEHFTGAAGNRLVADVYGEAGHPVLLLHGGGQTRHSWRGAALTIARSGRSAITLDLRGHGDSDWVASGEYRNRDFADDIRSVALQVAQRFGTRPVVVTASYSGITSLLAEGAHFTATGGNLLAGFFIVDMALTNDTEGARKVTGFMLAHAYEGFATVEEAADTVAAYLGRPKPKNPGGLQKNLRQGKDGRWRWHWDPKFMDGATHINTDRDEVDADMRAAVRDTTLPVLMVRGEASDVMLEEHIIELQKTAPRVRYVNVAGAHHMVVGEENDTFTQALIGFLDEADAARGSVT